ncbi:glycosyl-transferase for dystroglycan-domain-containing protein [Absidia repens]|uniref:Glycosyl-transferase for dystroglycan-domain-containing protein n=1 Tax=Absidia repens TaxID=90262 RepID=A0A1X2I0E7_9FUNG|nr:glycosyl-transferase for dystroglycan-domain-containing protein [Absidia repens]
MRDVKQSVFKLIQCLVIAYAVVSVIYTAKYFYSHATTPSSPMHNKMTRSDESTLAQAQVLQQQQQPLDENDDDNHSAQVTWHGSQTTMQEPLIMSKLFSDAMQPSHLQPYYYKARHTHDDQHSDDITMATLVTKDRFPVLSRLASNYRGPISAAIHVNDDDDKEQTLKDLAYVYDTNPDMQQYVDIHLVVDTFDRQFNLWRNVAKLFARTRYVMMLDVDFHVCTNLQSLRMDKPRLASYMRNDQTGQQRALVVPAFEYVAQADGLDYKTFPTTKEQLLEEVQQGKIDMFHKSWLKGHGATDYQRWYASNTSYVVTDAYDFSYEPYIIYNKQGTPWCDERFIGYGANKAACLYEIYLAGIEYMVLPDDFLIHQTHKYPENTRRKERQYNRKLYSNFREELCLRYARLFLANGDWETPVPRT